MLCLVAPERARQENAQLESRGRIECACFCMCEWMLFVPVLVFVCDLGSKLITCNAPGKPMFPP